MSHSHFLHLVLDWAKKCVELLRFQKAWEKGRVPEEEMADRAILSSEAVGMLEEAPSEESTAKGSKGRLKKALRTSKKEKGLPSTGKDIKIEVYGVGAPVPVPAENKPETVSSVQTDPSDVSETEIAEVFEKASEKSFSLIVESSEQIAFPGRPTLLVIDDYQPLREMTARAFRGNRYNVCTAKDGVEGIVRIHENDVDLIVTDVQMPRLDGFEMSKMLNVREKTRGIPVIFLTEVLDDQTKAISKRLGAADTLIKPFTMDALFESARTILLSHSKLDESNEIEETRATPESTLAAANNS